MVFDAFTNKYTIRSKGLVGKGHCWWINLFCPCQSEKKQGEMEIFQQEV